MKKKVNEVLDSYYGIPVTAHDFKDFTTVEERRRYRVIVIASVAGIVVFSLLALLGVENYMGTGVWWTLALMSFGYFFVFFPMGWGQVARDARPTRELVATLHPDRVDTFWYERGVQEHTSEPSLDDLNHRDHRAGGEQHPPP